MQFKRITSNLVLPVAAVVLAGLSAGAMTAELASDSFRRMLSHEPATHVPAVPANQAEDPLRKAMVVPLRDGRAGRVAAVGVAAERTMDEVAASFARMFEHSPNARQPAMPAGSPADPLIAARVEPLWQVAGNGAVRRELRADRGAVQAQP